MVGWHHRLNGDEFKQAPGVGDGQGSLVCPWGCKQLDMAEQLNSNTTERRSNLSILKKSTLNVIGRTDAEAPIL